MKKNNNQEKPMIDLSNKKNIYSQFKNYWSKRIDDKGFQEAQKELDNDYKSKSLSITHAAAHLWGEVVFRKLGLKGIKYCDELGEFGCYHQIYATSLSQKGLQIVKELDETCKNEYARIDNACEHGLGHALIDYFGRDKLVEALDHCPELSDPVLNGCWAGIFHEYNIYIVYNLNHDESKVREFDKRYPYEPCLSIPSIYQQVCHYRLGQWWNRAYTQDIELMGEFCGKVGEEKNKKACYRGIGYSVSGMSNFQPERIIADCRKIQREEGASLCLSEAAWATAHIKSKEVSLSICGGMGIKYYENCKARIENIRSN